MKPVLVTFNPYAVDCYTDDGEFIGGITRERMESRGNATFMVAQAVECILKALGHDVTVQEEEKRTFCSPAKESA